MFWVLFIICIIVGMIWGLKERAQNNQVLDENVLKQADIILDNNITVSQELQYRSFYPQWYWRFIIDEKHRSIHIIDANNKLLSIPFSKLIGCEILQDNEVTGGIKRAIVGGVLAGGAGAIVGANTAKTKVKSFIVVIYQDSLDLPQIPLTLISNETKKEHVDYKNANLFSSQVTASIKVLLHRQQNDQTPSGSPTQESSGTINKAAAKTDNIEAIKKYKELLDMGIITQEEFEAKKKQLLAD